MPIPKARHYSLILTKIQNCFYRRTYRTSAKKSSDFQYPRERPSKIDFRKQRLLEGPSPWGEGAQRADEVMPESLLIIALWSNFRQSLCSGCWACRNNTRPNGLSDRKAGFGDSSNGRRRQMHLFSLSYLLLDQKVTKTQGFLKMC